MVTDTPTVPNVLDWAQRLQAIAQTGLAYEEPRALGSETIAAGFFPRKQLPELSLSRVTPQQLARFFEHREHPEWPTDFD